MYGLMTRGCPYTSADRSSPSHGSDRSNEAESNEKRLPPPDQEALVCSMEEIRTEVVSDKYTDEDNSDAFSEMQGSILWPRRSYLYRVSFLSMMPAYGLFLFGFSCPFWMKKYQVAKHRGHYNQIDRVDVSIGLWRVCQGLDFVDLTDCTTLPDLSSYTMACQAMLCLCLIFAFLSLVFGLYENCATRYDIDDRIDVRTRRPEVNAIVAGIFGMIGVSLYGVLIIGVAKDGQGGVHWAFPLTACAVTGLTICGILMAISNPVPSSSAYGGHGIGLSRQNSSQARNLCMQDRLVSSNGMATPPPPPVNVSTTYGVAVETTTNSTEMTFMKRTDSFMSSHMSSPDLFTTTANADGSPSNQRTHVVETYDLYTRPDNPVKRHMIKRQQQQFESKAAQRRSWHFDESHGAYDVSDLINEPSGIAAPLDAKRKEGCSRPPVPPRRDKMQAPPPPLGQKPLQTIADEANDLMMLEDPVAAIPRSNTESSDQSEDQSKVVRRNTNPFLDDAILDPPPTTTRSSSSVSNDHDGNESWHNQPWPDPPTESEMFGAEDHQAGSRDNQINHSRSGSRSNDVPESLQYQPQNLGSLSRKPSTGSRGESRQQIMPPPDASGHDPSRKGSNERRSGSRTGTGSSRSSEDSQNSRPDAQVPVLKEYDNPLFRRQQQPTPRLDATPETSNYGPPPAYDSTSFITPAPRPSQPPTNHYAAPTIDPLHHHHNNKPSRNPSHNKSHPPPPPPPNHYAATAKDKDNNKRRQAPGHYDSPHPKPKPNPNSNPNPNPNPKPSKKPNAQHPKASPKTKPKPAEKSRPRQVKRVHNQRRAAPPGGESPVPHTPPPGYYSSNPDISRQSPRASPRVPRRRPESMGRDDVRDRTPDNRSHHYQHDDCSDYSATPQRPPPPYYPSNSPWDSDL